MGVPLVKSLVFRRLVDPCSAVGRLPNGLGPVPVLVIPGFPTPCLGDESTILRIKGYRLAIDSYLLSPSRHLHRLVLLIVGLAPKVLHYSSNCSLLLSSVLTRKRPALSPNEQGGQRSASAGWWKMRFLFPGGVPPSTLLGSGQDCQVGQ
ncbi:hypothetical protein BDW75DRAFT_50337 [Aspergillus navahoensis]